jgi:hypothetical protein
VLEQFNGVKMPITGKGLMFIFVAAILAVGIYPAILTDLFNQGILPVMGFLGG